MVTVKLTKDLPDSGLSKGDVLSVDKFSAKSLVERGVATEYNADDSHKHVETIDDIHDSELKHDRRVSAVVRVGGPEPAKPESKRRPSGPAASGAEPVGGAGHGGSTG